GGYSVYGPEQVFILPRGAGGRLAWVHQVDLHATVDLRLSTEMVLSVGADCFNVLGSQQVVAVDQSYVFPRRIEVVPIPGGTVTDLPSKVIDVRTGQPITAGQINTNYGRPMQYQPPRDIRFLARLNF